MLLGQPSVLLGRLCKTHGKGLATETVQNVRDGADAILVEVRPSDAVPDTAGRTIATFRV